MSHEVIYVIERKFSDEGKFRIVEMLETSREARENVPGWKIGDREMFDGKSVFRIRKYVPEGKEK